MSSKFLVSVSLIFVLVMNVEMSVFVSNSALLLLWLLTYCLGAVYCFRQMDHVVELCNHINTESFKQVDEFNKKYYKNVCPTCGYMWEFYPLRKKVSVK